MTDIAVIVLNYASAQDTIACVDSLKRLDAPQPRIIVVDNASPDDSVSRIRAAHPDIMLVASPVNGGYSAGNNLGVGEALADPAIRWIWLLNNDATVAPDTLNRLREIAEIHPKDLIGPRIVYPDGRFQTVGHRILPASFKAKAYDEREVSDGQTVETLCGCSMLIPCAVLETVGLLDERYFLYLEDVAYCLKASQAGFTCRVALQAEVRHALGATTGRNRPLVTYYYQRNRLLLARAFTPPGQFRRLLWYHRVFRRGRERLKVLLKPTPEKQAHWRAFALALSDFERGVTGPCPHPL